MKAEREFVRGAQRLTPGHSGIRIERTRTKRQVLVELPRRTEDNRPHRSGELGYFPTDRLLSPLELKS